MQYSTGHLIVTGQHEDKWGPRTKRRFVGSRFFYRYIFLAILWCLEREIRYGGPLRIRFAEIGITRVSAKNSQHHITWVRKIQAVREVAWTVLSRAGCPFNIKAQHGFQFFQGYFSGIIERYFSIFFDVLNNSLDTLKMLENLWYFRYYVSFFNFVHQFSQGK